MTMTQDLFMAILAMDSYNRGYNEGIAGLGGEGERIGFATLSSQSDLQAGSEGVAAGFYAVAYDWNGVTVISYRGTDVLLNTPWDDNPSIGGEIWNAYLTGLGDPLTTQAVLAAEFFQSVSGTQQSDPSAANVIVTGHSSGGGLAGFIASIYGQQGYIFDNMAFELSAYHAYLGSLGGGLLGSIFYNGLAPTAPEIGEKLHAYAVFGEFLAANRVLQSTDVEYISSSAGFFRDPVNILHSQSMLAILMYADGKGTDAPPPHAEWRTVGTLVWDAILSNDVAAAGGFLGAGPTGRYDAYAKLMSAIAYSALDSGSHEADADYGYVFGNTAIRALFGDADELGSLVSADKVSEALEDSMAGLLQAVVQFAGLMASRGINYRAYQGEDQPFDPLEGVIALSDVDGKLTHTASSAVVLKLSVNQDLWKLGVAAGAPDIEILGLGTLVEDLLDQASSDLNANTIREAMEILYGVEGATFSVTKAIGSVEFNLAQGPINLTLPEGASGYDATHTGLYVAGDAADIIHGSSQNNMIAGSDGGDVIYGRLGRDLLLGGDGSDLFVDSVTERSETDGRQNEDDVYIGSSQYTGLLTNFLQWLLNGNETDVVRYTVDNLAVDDPETPQDENHLQQQGLRVTNVETTTLGGSEAIKLTVADLGSGKAGTDHLIGIEKVELSDRPDEILVTDAALKAAILIDMGKSSRIESELPDGEVLAPDAFTTKVDVADYSGLTHGINYLNGVTSDRQQVSSLEGVFQWAGWGDELLTVADYAAKGALGHNDALQIVGADRIKLTDHDDVLINAEFGSIIETGAGDDKIWLSDGVAITDLSDDDRITLAGVITLYGGMRNSVSEDARAWGAYGTSYGLNDSGELVISNAFWRVTYIDENGVPQSKAAEMYVLNWAATYGAGTSWATGAGNISLIEYTITSSRLLDLTGDEKGTVSFVGAGLFELLGYYMKTITGEASFGNTDPLVLDLDGDGVELTSLDHSKARFDTDNDLYAEATGFVGKDDGILVRDINGDGKINSAAEMFGGGGVTGFGALSALDGNADGVIDASDNGLADFDGDGDVDANDRFDRLMVWQDRNENHATDLGELKSVSEWGIASIAIPGQGQGASGQVVAGNTIDRVSSYTLSDGTVRTVADVSFKVENQNTTYVGQPIAISSSVLDLANLKGYGTLVSLHEAMSLRPASETTVRTTLDSLSSNDLATLRDEIKPILRAWAEGSPVKVNGQVTTGVVSQNAYEDLVVVKDASGKVVDYVWGFSRSGQAFGTFANETSPAARFAFASGVIVSLGGSYGAGIDERTDLSALIGSLAEDGAVSVTTGSTVDASGKTVGYLQYASQDGYVRIYYQGSSSWSSALNSAADHSLPTGFGFSGIAAEDFAFYERLIGESLQPFFVKPDSASGGYSAVNEFLSKMEGTLNLFAVRLAVQSGPLSHHFDSIVYDAAKDQFRSADGHQLSDVFDSVLNDAETGGNAFAQLQGWKPFFDVFLADYSRGSSAKQVSYSFLVQNMLHSVEQAAGGVTIEQFAQAFGVPQDIIVSGAGELTGTSDIDLFIIDGGETLASGGAGADSYVIGRNFGAVTIYDNDGALGSDVDTIRFSGHNVEDVEATRDGIDLILTDKVTGSSIRITNQFEGRWPGATISDASFDYGVNQIIFADGTLWNKVDIAEQVSKIDDASTTIVGTADVDVLQGGGGDDVLQGAGDTDIYRIGRGDGKDVIDDLENNAFRNDQDMLQFLDGIRLDDLIFVRDGASNDLSIRFKDSPADEVKILGQFSATYTGIYGTWYQNRIELITFDNGSSLSHDQLANLVLRAYSTDGDDQLYGMNREDVLDAGKGNDFLSGGNESDTYVFGRGYGHDVIEDNMTNFLSGTSDKVFFRSDISLADLDFSKVEGSDSVLITVRGAEDSLILKDQYAYVETGVFGAIFFDRIEEFVFSDGSGRILTHQDVAEIVLAAQATEGDDHIYGFSIADTLDGGAGNDILEGGGDSDTYLFGRGYGHDRIIEALGVSVLAPNQDRLIFKDLVLSDLTVSRTSYDLIFTINDTQETITLQNQFDRPPIGTDPWVAVDLFEFSDGTVLTFEDFAPITLPLIGTSGSDEITGSQYGEILDGREGDDVLIGSQGSDTYIFDIGYGKDTIIDGKGYVGHDQFDVVQFGSGIALSDLSFSNDDNVLVISHSNGIDELRIVDQFSYTWFRIEEFRFADGTVLTQDDVFAAITTHASSAANETLVSTKFNDTYEYERGDGHDIIADTGILWGTSDRLLLKGIDPHAVSVIRDGNDVTLVIAESATGAGDHGSVKIVSGLHNHNDAGVEQILFDDGTVWTPETLRDRILTSTSANETFVGFAGSDTYRYARGGGHDVIDETGILRGNNDTLIMVDVASTAVSLSRNGSDVTLNIAESASGAGDAGSILIRSAINNAHDAGIEKILFSDGVVWTPASLLAQLIDGAGTEQDDTINGTGVSNLLRGLGGNDRLVGGGGNDTYVYDRGDGHDVVEETGILWGNADVIRVSGVAVEAVTLLRNGNDVTLEFADSVVGAGDGGSIKIISGLHNNNDVGVEQIVFDDGTVWTPQDLRERLLTSTAANETFLGFAGNDTYRYSRGGGHDVIDETGILWGSNDKLLLTDINSDELVLSRNGDDVRLIFSADVPNEAGSIVISQGLSGSNAVGVEQIVFADGTIWTRADLIANIAFVGGSDGNDVINGTSVSDAEIRAGLGNDSLNGLAGSDTYVYRLGDGNDVITEVTSGTDVDTLALADLNLSDIRFERPSSNMNDVVIRILQNSETITLKNQFNQAGGIERITFADGTVLGGNDWSLDIYLQGKAVVYGTSGNDTIAGTSGDDVFVGGLGDDRFNSGAGSDTYVYASGDGSDFIDDESGSTTDIDVVKLIDLNVGDVTFSRSGTHVKIMVISTGHVITLDEQLYSTTANWGIEQIHFSDGTIWSRAQIAEASVPVSVGTAGHDTLMGTSSADIIDGGAGDDVMNGGEGNDTFVYARGDGNDTITEQSWNGDNDRLVFSDINPSEVSLSYTGTDLTISIAESSPGAGDGGSIKLVGTLADNRGQGVDGIVFADGTTWNAATIRAKAIETRQTAGSDTIVGFNANETITGGAGDDVMNGGEGNDTFVYARGDGNDTITEQSWNGDNDRLVFSDINPSEVSLSYTGTDLTISIAESSPGAGDGGSIKLVGTLADNRGQGVDGIVFADGTTWNAATIRAKAIETRQTAGSDTIVGFNANETITGGAGDDVMNGGEGNDTFVYARGDGNDTITEQSWNGDNDRLVFSDINPSEVSLSYTGTDLTISIAESSPGAGDGGSIKLVGTLADNRGQGVDGIVFADGTTWNAATIRAKAIETRQTAGSDTIVGFNANETITGGAGDDVMNGGEGNDTFVYARGDGNDTITEQSWNGDNDRLVFSDINPSEVSLSYTGTDLTISIAESSPGAGDGGSIKLVGTLADNRGQGVDGIVFADGTTWNAATIRAKAIETRQTAGSDTIVGFNANETITGGAGDDVMNGGEGNDTFVYARGDGNDTITEQSWNGDNDRLVFSDINPSEVSLSYTGTDLTISIAESSPGAGDGGSIKLVGTLADNRGQGVDGIVFADGTTWNAATIRAKAIETRQTAGSDTIVGFNANETITGGAGDDVMNGGEGNDTFVYARGDGNDTITEQSWNGDNDRLVFSDINPSGVTLFRNGNDVTIVVAESSPGAGDAGSVLLKSSLIDNRGEGVDKVVFSDGTTWDRNTMISNVDFIAGTDGNDTIIGTSGADTILAGLGNDTITTGAGNDIIVFKPNFGIDTITDFQVGAGSVDVFEFDNSLFADFEAVLAAAAQVGSDTLITYDAANTITLKNVALTSLHQDDFRFVA
ncbi:calcium-binding protein [Rhizobium sp. SL42]|uniref:calcium-binding protein n=1 Tax=Rhizobium sp. SL42 TaxID=2806346 RepID=UPI001F314FC1|nr:calcium-binding protein [Rhizobium sp. SL42]UJW73550.1 hypothetical protein IM739_11575 [Rhizobium sp. SL42]